mmetsp:Transcript_21411/g.53952  ORF Transcript_21411/g.53952 Transcript_21411/m.53952 type:complete len:235 (-) Transcript_21411:367-1071(-)
MISLPICCQPSQHQGTLVSLQGRHLIDRGARSRGDACERCCAAARVHMGARRRGVWPRCVSRAARRTARSGGGGISGQHRSAGAAPKALPSTAVSRGPHCAWSGSPRRPRCHPWGCTQTWRQRQAGRTLWTQGGRLTGAARRVGPSHPVFALSPSACQTSWPPHPVPPGASPAWPPRVPSAPPSSAPSPPPGAPAASRWPRGAPPHSSPAARLPRPRPSPWTPRRPAAQGRRSP